METWKSVFPPPVKFSEKDLPDQSGKVFVVTGSTSGIGKHLAAILYERNGNVYIAARSTEKAQQTIKELQENFPDSTGKLTYLHLDLSDLSTIKASAENFLQSESRLDVLWNNAGVMAPPQGSKTKQGYELQFGTNNLGPFLFTEFLRPLLVETAKSAPKYSVRVIWVSSSAVEMAPKPAIDFSNMDYKKEEGIWSKYARSKAGNVLHSAEFARRAQGTGVLSLALNPGNFITDLQRTMPGWQLALFKHIAQEPKNGAYTELFAGLSPAITEASNGKWVAPFGRLAKVRQDLLEPELGNKFWQWSEEQVKPFR